MRAVLVTTAHRGVFFGILKEDSAPDEITLADARNCIYWSSDVGGFLGLASIGPSEKCKIGRQADLIRLFNITSITDVSPKAVEKWRNA